MFSEDTAAHLFKINSETTSDPVKISSPFCTFLHSVFSCDNSRSPTCFIPDPSLGIADVAANGEGVKS